MVVTETRATVSARFKDTRDRKCREFVHPHWPVLLWPKQCLWVKQRQRVWKDAGSVYNFLVLDALDWERPRIPSLAARNIS
jgi:hypothetical protein